MKIKRFTILVAALLLATFALLRNNGSLDPSRRDSSNT